MEKIIDGNIKKFMNIFLYFNSYIIFKYVIYINIV